MNSVVPIAFIQIYDDFAHNYIFINSLMEHTKQDHLG